MSPMSDEIYYDRQGRPIDRDGWGELIQRGTDPDGHYGSNSYKRVGEDTVGDAWVSTVWLGIDHGFIRGGPPVIFETMVFGGEHDQDQWRYCTEEAAIAGHRRVVENLRAGRDPFDEMEGDW